MKDNQIIVTTILALRYSGFEGITLQNSFISKEFCQALKSIGIIAREIRPEDLHDVHNAANKAIEKVSNIPVPPINRIDTWTEYHTIMMAYTFCVYAIKNPNRFLRPSVDKAAYERMKKWQALKASIGINK